jgi:hypothetical protein
MTIKIVPNEKGNPPGKLADVELHFTSGPLEGLKLIGFGVWERRGGNGRNVTFPARQHSLNGERRSFALLRPVADATTQNDAFRTIGYTIGGMMVFPGNRIDGKSTINIARGFNRKIADRLDLTLECIRRHYLGLRSPLAEPLARYRDFFALFGDFRGSNSSCCEDLVTDDCSGVRFFMPFDDFNTPSVPRNGDTYKEYRRLSIEFTEARNVGSIDTLR